MTKLNIFGSNSESYVKAMGNAENLNCYMFPTPDAENPWSLIGRMGYEVFAEGFGDLPCRGALVLNNVVYAVFGQTLYSITELGVVTALNTISGVPDVSIITDGVLIMVVNGTTTAQYYNPSTDTQSNVTLPFAATYATYIDGYAVLVKDEGQFFISNADDITTYNALDFATAQYLPDGLVSLAAINSELVLFGEDTIEFWNNTANTNFAFSPIISQVIDTGIIGPHAVVKNKSLYFVGSDLIIYQMQGFSAVPISTEAENILLRKIYESEGGITDVVDTNMLSYTEHGHDFIQVTVPNRISICYNATTQQWHRVKNWELETDVARSYVRLRGLHYMLGLDGVMYQMSNQFYSDGPLPLRRGRRTQFFSASGEMIHYKMLKFIMSFGETSVVDGSQGTTPVMMVRWSDDQGHTWKSEKHLTIGVQGDYNAKCIKRNCGSSRSRQIEFYVTDPVPFHLIDALVHIE